jgi:hypothetical protein
MMAVGIGLTAVYEIAIASLTLAQTLAAEQREPTDEEIDALSLRNRIKIAQVKADIEGRQD